MNLNEVLQLEAKYLKGDSLSPKELKIATDGLVTESSMGRLIACEALLRSQLPENDVGIIKAIHVLESMCRDATTSNAGLNVRLVLALYHIPTRVILRSEIMREVAYLAALDSSKGCRRNAQLALRQLAAHGDARSLELLQKALGDPDEYVRHNARNCLQQLEKM
jgi:hypothetical protein